MTKNKERDPLQVTQWLLPRDYERKELGLLMQESQATYFAPAERAPAGLVTQQSRDVESLCGTCSFFDALPNVVMVLNRQRQVVFCNRGLLDLLGVEDHEAVRGLRPGEILRCIHSCEVAGGCGTSESCRNCGAVNAILESQHGHKVYHECRISVNAQGHQDSLDLGITAVPLKVGSEDFTVLSMVDISDEKRRRVLERIFFHDVMNTAGGIMGLAELLEDMDNHARSGEFLADIRSSARILVEQIREQRDLMMAENNELKAEAVPLYSLDLLAELTAFFNNHEAARGRLIRVDPGAENVLFHSNPQLLHRILGNMLKNALEASGEGETVRLGCRQQNGQVEFWVNNPGVMPREVQLQLYQRSFSTKGSNRGLGTYSMKLLTERYLRGTISLTVAEKEGTTFFARYPLDIR